MKIIQKMKANVMALLIGVIALFGAGYLGFWLAGKFPVVMGVITASVMTLALVGLVFPGTRNAFIKTIETVVKLIPLGIGQFIVASWGAILTGAVFKYVLGMF